MKTIIKLTTFFGLLSVCFGLSLPREFFLRVCETTQTAKELGLSPEKINQLVFNDLEDFTNKFGLTFGLQRNLLIPFTNNGNRFLVDLIVGLLGPLLPLLLPIVSSLVLPIIELLLSILLNAKEGITSISENDQFPEGYPDLFKPNIYDILTTAGQQVVNIDNNTSDLDPISCSQFDFPEKIDPTNETDVRQAITQLIQSGLKLQGEKLKQLENTVTTIQEKLFSQQNTIR